MVIIDAIILTLINFFDKLDWGLARYTNYYLRLKGAPESSAFNFFALISSLIICCILMPFIGEVLGILLALVLFLVFSYFASKYYSGRKEELEKRFYTNRPSNRILSIIITLIFILLPIFILIALIKFN